MVNPLAVRVRWKRGSTHMTLFALSVTLVGGIIRWRKRSRSTDNRGSTHHQSMQVKKGKSYGRMGVWMRCRPHFHTDSGDHFCVLVVRMGNRMGVQRILRTGGKDSMREDEEDARRRWQAPDLSQADLITAAAGLAATYPQITAVYLFGSRARGTVRPTSDVDFAVLLEEPAAAETRISLQAAMARQVEEMLHAPTDVIVLVRDLSLPLLFDIFSVETILFARDHERAHEFACRARGWYREELPRLEWIRKRVADRIRERANALERS